MFINFWYPVCLADELTSEAPKAIELLGVRLVAFRDQQGQAHLLSDTCVHRGGSLSGGKINGDQVACPYHGWEFNGAGQCSKIPSMPNKTPPARAKVDSYPTQERYGIVFAFLGDLPEAERPPLYQIEEYGTDGWRANTVEVFEINTYYERSMENGLDPAHNEFVHPSQGFPSMLPETLKTWEMDWGNRFEMRFGDPVNEMTTFQEEKKEKGKLKAGSWFHGPNVLGTSIFINDTDNFVQYFFEAPINRNKTRIFFVNMRNCMLKPEMDEMIMEVNMKIASEDVAVLEGLWPVRTPDTMTREIMTPADGTIVKYREWLKKWQQLGWQIDSKKMAFDDGDIAYTIPCPARRESASWVLPALPLLDGSD